MSLDDTPVENVNDSSWVKNTNTLTRHVGIKRIEQMGAEQETTCFPGTCAFHPRTGHSAATKALGN